MGSSIKQKSAWVVMLLLSLQSLAFVKMASGQESQQDKAGSSRAIAVAFASTGMPDQIAASKTDIYWVAGGNKALVKKSKNGGSSVLLFSVSLPRDFVNDVAADDTGVYFATTYGIMRIDNSGGKPVVLASTINNRTLALDETNVYWAGHTGSEKRGTSLMKVSKTGGAPIALVSDVSISFAGLAVDRTNVYFTSLVAIDNTNGYREIYELRKIGKLGGEPSTIAKNLIGESQIAIAVDETSIYAAAGEHTSAGTIGTIVKIDKATGALRTLVPKQSRADSGIAIDEMSVYWTTGDIMKVSKSGGQPVVLAVAHCDSGKLAVDDTGVYCTEIKRGLVMRVALAAQTESPGNALTARNQERFDAQGEFLPHGKVPQGFEKIGGFRLWCNKHGGSSDRRSGVYTREGATYGFQTITVNQKEFSFTTEEIRGISYSFAGHFLRGGVFREADLDVQIPILSGVISKYKAGRKVAEAPLRFAYLACT